MNIATTIPLALPFIGALLILSLINTRYKTWPPATYILTATVIFLTGYHLFAETGTVKTITPLTLQDLLNYPSITVFALMSIVAVRLIMTKIYFPCNTNADNMKQQYAATRTANNTKGIDVMVATIENGVARGWLDGQEINLPTSAATKVGSIVTIPAKKPL